MAATGLKPSNARPAVKVTACCSQIPTSKKRSGYKAANWLKPVPSGIAAVMATILSSSSASFTMVCPKILVYEGAPGLVAGSPVLTSNLPRPWNLEGSHSAGL